MHNRAGKYASAHDTLRTAATVPPAQRRHGAKVLTAQKQVSACRQALALQPHLRLPPRSGDALKEAARTGDPAWRCAAATATRSLRLVSAARAEVQHTAC